MPSRKDIDQATEHYTARTIPVLASVGAKQIVLSQPDMQELLSAARLIALGNCDCREKQGKCDGPIEVCLSLNESAEATIAHGKARPVSLPEALHVLQLSHTAGLVHLAYRQGEQPIGQVCSCCSCCCWFLNALKRFDYHAAVVESGWVVRFRPEFCNGCAVCIERCQFEAWQRSDDGVRLDPRRCFGCGLCVSTCPTGAIAFVARSGQDVGG